MLGAMVCRDGPLTRGVGTPLLRHLECVGPGDNASTPLDLPVREDRHVFGRQRLTQTVTQILECPISIGLLRAEMGVLT